METIPGVPVCLRDASDGVVFDVWGEMTRRCKLCDAVSSPWNESWVAVALGSVTVTDFLDIPEAYPEDRDVDLGVDVVVDPGTPLFSLLGVVRPVGGVVGGVGTERPFGAYRLE